MQNKVIKVERMKASDVCSKWTKLRNTNSNEFYQIITLDNGKKYIDDYPGCEVNNIGVPRPNGEIAHDWSNYIGRTVKYSLASVDNVGGVSSWVNSQIERQWIRFINLVD